MSTPCVLVDLPSGLRMWAPNRSEALVLHHEIFEAGAYDKHGIEVGDGDCVFDVGANAGFFSVHLSRQSRGLRLYAFEPVPEVFDLLTRNAREHLGGSAVRLLPFGLSGEAAIVSFRHDPAFTLSTTYRPDDVRRAKRRDLAPIDWARAVVADRRRSGEIGGWAARLFESALATPGSSLATVSLMRLLAKARQVRRRLGERDVVAEVRPLSDVMREEGVARIDLLKIDVEGAEWDVLQGIEEAHWPGIRQIVVEAHDVDGRVEQVRALLSSKGYSVVVDREDWALHELLGIHTVFARRPVDDASIAHA